MIKAFLVLEAGYSVTDVRNELSKYLPEYMIPRSMIPVDRLPVNANGKIDRMELENR